MYNDSSLGHQFIILCHKQIFIYFRSTDIEFLHELDKKGDQTFYQMVIINGVNYEIGDHAEVVPVDEDCTPFYCKIISLSLLKLDKKRTEKIAHVRWFDLGENTVLGDTADPKELFAVYNCEDTALEDFIRPIFIQHCPIDLGIVSY